MKELLDKVCKESVRINEGYSKQEIEVLFSIAFKILAHAGTNR